MTTFADNPGLPGGTSTTSDIYIDGSPMQPPDFYQISANLYHEGGKHNKAFWASAPRRQADTTVDVYDITLSSKQLVNTITFSLARFPHRVRAQYLDSDGNWQPMKHSFGTPVVYAINDSLPSIISPNALAQGASHPQHYGAGHWLRQKAVLLPFRTKRVRLLLERSVGAPPLDTNRNAVPYSLGVREFSVGYKADAKSKIPRTRRHPTVHTEYDPFATGLDSLGSPLAYAARENRASDLLLGKTWRCEPQPVPDAVVSLYVDTRDEDGEAPVVDRFHIDPLTHGVQMNLYYSNDDSSELSFTASDDLMLFPNSSPLGVLTPKTNGLLFDDPNASITFVNKAIQWHPANAWWMGFRFSPKYDSSDATDRVLLDSSLLRIVLTAGVINVTMGSTSVSQGLTFAVGDEITFVVSFSDGALTLTTTGGSSSSNDPALVTDAEETTVTQIRMGANLLDLVGSSYILLYGFVLKQETVADPAALFSAFAADPDNYIVKAEFEDEDTGGTDNAILRYHPSFQTPGVESLNPTGFIGGPGDLFADKEWTPISRDYRLTRGMLHFPPTKAKYFKFEFTELSAGPYDTYAPVTKRVKKHPTWVLEANKDSKKGGPRKATAKGGLSTSVDLGVTEGNFSDTRRFIGVEPRTTSAAASMVATDQALARQMRQISSYFNLVKWLPGSTNTKWPKGKHFYATVDIDHVHRVAYFVGINSIEMFRLDYTVDDDSEQYVEVFHDDDNLLVNQWMVGDNKATASTAPSIMESKVMNSRRKIRGVQFATTQSKPLQLLSDPDFLDLTLANWAPYGDVSELTFSQELETELGSTIHIVRNMGMVGRSWNDTEDLYPNWDAIDGIPWENVESDPGAINYGGVVGTQEVTPTSQGRVYAAVRVFIDEPLSSPLYLQLVTPGNDVVAETVFDPQPGQINEWYTGYTIGEGGATTGLTWDGMEALYANWDAAEAAGTWSQTSQQTEPLETTLLPRLVQYGLTDDEWDVDNISIFNDPIVWEFSNDGGTTFYPAYDIRNNPDGVIIFPDSDVLDPSSSFGTRFAWRATSYYLGSWVTGLVVRPWYTGLSLGIPHREAIQYGGPNHSLWDDYPEIHEDPHWMVWHLPVPQDWWFRYRRSILPTLIPYVPSVEDTLPDALLNDTLVVV